MRFPRILTGGMTLGTAAAAAVLFAPGAMASSPSPAASPTAAPTASGLSAPLASGLLGPTQLKVARGGSVLLSESFAGNLSKVRDGKKTVLSGGYDEVNGVALDGYGNVDFTTGSYPGEQPNAAKAAPAPTGGPTTALLRHLDPHGNVTTLADLGAYERDHNPDAKAKYGFVNLSKTCAKSFPPPSDEVPPAAPTPGAIDSHPYSVAALPFGYKVVGDAAGNDLLLVSPSGNITTLAVLPGIPVKVTAAAAKAAGLPACVAGTTYVLEPVPTDVQLRGINLYITTLPGGPEDGSLGANGSVYEFNLFSRELRRVATGFSGASNLAIGPDGTIYVSELFADRISKIVNGKPVKVVDVPQPGGLDYAYGKLYIAENLLGDAGADLVTYPLR